MRRQITQMLERLWKLKRRKQVEQDIDEELHAHIDMRTADNIAGGMPEEEARRDARLRFGNPAVVREQVQAVDLALTVDINLSLSANLLGWMDLRVVAFAVCVSALSGVVFSLVPALRLP